MSDSIHQTLATPLQRRFAAFMAATIVLLMAITIPYTGMPLPVVTPFLPMFGAVVVLTEGMTAYLLMVQFMATRRLYLVLMAGAYAYVALLVSVQLMVFPGVFAPAGLLGGNSQSAVWLWVFWHGGYPLLIGLSIVLRDWKRHAGAERQVSSGQGVMLFCVAPALALLAAYLALGVTLPSLIQGNNFKTLSTSVPGWMVWGLNLTALLLVLRQQKKGRDIVSLFLFVAVLASLADVSLTLLSSARYSAGWYVSRMLSIASSVSLLAALILQLTRLYQELALSHASLLHTSARDGLTGIYNRRSFDGAAHAEWLRAQRSREPLSLVLLDVDHFKQYNDHFGHVQGDTCLRAVAKALAQSVNRSSDMVARYGGEEFILLLPSTPGKAALKLAEKARQAIAALQMPAITSSGTVSISGGCATWHDASNYQTLEELVTAADQALYQAKERGRNQVLEAEL